jgi:hypothetical protein
MLTAKLKLLDAPHLIKIAVKIPRNVGDATVGSRLNRVHKRLSGVVRSLNELKRGNVG